MKPGIFFLHGTLLLAASLNLWAHEGAHLAIERTRNEIEASPKDETLHLRHARLLIDHHQPLEALAVLDRARTLGAAPSACQMLRADALLALDRPAEALASLQLILADHPEHLPALHLRARAHAAAGDRAKAISDCRYITELAPDPDIAFLAADLLVAAAKPLEAIKFLDSSFPLSKRPSAIHQRALEIEISQLDWDAAQRRLDQKIATSPRPEPSIARKAELFALAGQNDQSLATWQALATRLSTLPAPIRSSRSMLRLAERTQEALNPAKP